MSEGNSNSGNFIGADGCISGSGGGGYGEISHVHTFYPDPTSVRLEELYRFVSWMRHDMYAAAAVNRAIDEITKILKLENKDKY